MSDALAPVLIGPYRDRGVGAAAVPSSVVNTWLVSTQIEPTLSRSTDWPSLVRQQQCDSSAERGRWLSAMVGRWLCETEAPEIQAAVPGRIEAFIPARSVESVPNQQGNRLTSG